jgi:Zn-dependent peptidase ImmA (M78 family)
MSNFIKAKQTAEEVLKENYVTTPPVPVVEIAKNYGYQVIEGELPSNIAGLVDLERHIIYVNQFDSPTRKAFTIAHELGHIKLHADLLQKNPDMTILYRRPLGKKDDKTEEQEANCFAASLLVPDEMLQNILKEYSSLKLTDENNRNSLATIFGVSNEVIGYRLHDLQLNNGNG